MKKVVRIAILLFFAASDSEAQNCNDLPQFIQGRSLVYETYDAKGKLSLEQTQTVSSVSTADGNRQTASINAVLRNDKGKEISNTEYKLVCSAEGFAMDMQMMIPGETQNAYKGMEARVVSGNLIFPPQMAAGQSLPDGKVEVEYFNSGTRMAKVIVELTERKVEALEEIRVPSGTYRACKIAAKSRVLTETMIMPVKIEFTTITWFDYKAGVVRTESVRSNGKPDGYTILKVIR